MEYYNTIKFYIDRKMIDLSHDQVMRRIGKLKNSNINSDVIQKKLIGRSYAWTINYKKLFCFQRIRKKINDRIKKEIPVNKSLVNKCINYNYEITINLKGGIDGKTIDNGYDYKYYAEFADSLFKIVRSDMFYNIEIDESGYYHIHIGILGEEKLIQIAVDFVLRNINGFDEDFLNSCNVVHIKPIINLFAYKEYASKQDVITTYIYKDENYYE